MLDRRSNPSKFDDTCYSVTRKDFAFEYFKSPGHTAVVRGEVVHIGQYEPVDVQYHLCEKNKCYDEIPVLFNNITMYIFPRSRMLTLIGNEIDCSSELNPRFFINDNWYTPTIHGLAQISYTTILFKIQI